MHATTNTTTPGPTTVSTTWADRLAALVAELRTDWDAPGVRSTLLKVADRPLGVVAAAAITAAMTRHDQRSPAIIALEGAHWPTWQAWTPPRAAGLVTYCAHGEPGARCPDCYPRGVRGVGPSPELRARMRADVAAGKAALQQLDRTRPAPDVEAAS